MKFYIALALMTLCVHARTAAAQVADPGDNTIDPYAPDAAPGAAPAADMGPERAEEASAGATSAGEGAILAGRVFERGSLVPLNGARVIAEMEDGAPVETATDAEGRFRLELPAGPYRLAISFEGYETLTTKETLAAGRLLGVEYRLAPLSSAHRRYYSTVRGEGLHEGERFTVRDEELYTTAGTLGDPFRIIGLLPGVATPITLLPVFIVRGASPGNNGYFLDGMRVPQLMHFLVAGGVVHPRLIERLDFYPGVYDTSFGHYAGGITDSETRPARADAPFHAELELKLYDISALAEAKLPGGVLVEAGGHFGYPAYIIKAFDSRVDLSYWDFQFRLDWKTITVEAFGSFDDLSLDPSLALENGVPSSILGKSMAIQNRIEWYRVQVRDRHKIGRVQTEAAVVGGYDFLRVNGPAVTKWSLALRGSLRARWRRFLLHVGADTELSRYLPANFDLTSNGNNPDDLGDLGGRRDGVIAGAFAQGTVEILRHRLWMTAGSRIDLYHAGAVTLLGVDPRLQLRAKLMPALSLTGGIGYYHQPPSFPIAVPGIDTFALQLGLQEAIQGAFGVEATLPAALTFGVTGFWHQFHNVNDADIYYLYNICSSPPPESLSGYPGKITRTLDGQSYGMESTLRRREGRFTGWIAYTLSRSERSYTCGLRPSDFDMTHVLNVVGQVRLPWNLMASARFLYQSGRPWTKLEPPNGQGTIRNNSNLPDTIQLDVRFDREWIFSRWALSVFLEVVNVTYAQSVLGLNYPTDMNTHLTDYSKPEIVGFKWLLPSLGVRGRI